MDRYDFWFLVGVAKWGIGLILVIAIIGAGGWYLASRPKGAVAAPPPRQEAAAQGIPGDPASLIAALDREIERHPRDANLLVERANLRLRAGQWTAALADADSALAIEGRHPAALLARGAAKTLSGDPEAGLRALDAASEAGADARQVATLRAAALLGVGRLAEARDIVDGLISENPLDGAAFGLRAEIGAMEGRFEDALRDAVAACALIEHPKVRVLRGIALVGLARWPDAISAFADANKMDPLDPVPWLGAATALRALGKDGEADAALARAAAALPPEMLKQWPTNAPPPEFGRALLKAANRDAWHSGK